MNLMSKIVEALAHPKPSRAERDAARETAARQARKAQREAHASKLLRELDISEKQYRIRVRGKGLPS